MTKSNHVKKHTNTRRKLSRVPGAEMPEPQQAEMPHSFFTRRSPWRVITLLLAVISLVVITSYNYVPGLQGVLPILVALSYRAFRLFRDDFKQINLSSGVVFCIIMLCMNGALLWLRYPILNELLFNGPPPISAGDRYLFSAFGTINGIVFTLSFEAVKPFLISLMGKSEEKRTPQPLYTWIIFLVSLIGMIALGSLAAAAPSIDETPNA
jgi:hypothetical protein